MRLILQIIVLAIVAGLLLLAFLGEKRLRECTLEAAAFFFAIFGIVAFG
jgi:hypothetical protein